MVFTDEFHNSITKEEYDYLIKYLSQDARATTILLSFITKEQDVEEEEQADDDDQFLQEALDQFEAIFAEGK